MNFLLGKVFAQVDGVASPTIPFTAPGSPTTPTPTAIYSDAGTEPSISLNTPSSSLAIGEKTIVQIIIDTNLEPINKYSVQILYNPTLLKITDFDPSTPTTEIDFQDTFFDAMINDVSLQQGIITLSAENPTGSTSITDRVVAEFEIEAVSSGFAELTFSMDNTMLLDDHSVDILESTNELELILGGTTGEDEGPIIEDDETITVVPTNEIPLPSQTPSTALPDNLRGPTVILVGVTLILAGSYLYKLRDSHANQKN